MKSKILLILMIILSNVNFGSYGSKISWERPISSDEAEALAQKLQKEGFEDESLRERILKESKVPESVIAAPVIERASWTEAAEQKALAPYKERIAAFKKAYENAQQPERKTSSIKTIQATGRQYLSNKTLSKELPKKNQRKLNDKFQDAFYLRNFKKMKQALLEGAHISDAMLRIAIERGDAEMVQFLIDNGVNAQVSNGRNTILIALLQYPFTPPEVIKILLKNGVQLDSSSYDLVSPESLQLLEQLKKKIKTDRALALSTFSSSHRRNTGITNTLAELLDFNDADF